MKLILVEDGEVVEITAADANAEVQADAQAGAQADAQADAPASEEAGSEGAVSEEAGSEGAIDNSQTDNSKTGNQTPQFEWLPIVLMVAMIAIMYLVMIRPQRKRQKEEQKMRNSLRVGDEITTIGGICGRVLQVKDDSLVIETGADRSKMTIKKWAIQSCDTVRDPADIDDDDDDDDDI